MRSSRESPSGQPGRPGRRAVRRARLAGAALWVACITAAAAVGHQAAANARPHPTATGQPFQANPATNSAQVPSKPSAPILIPDDNEIEVIWTEPTLNGSAITKYRLAYGVKDQNPTYLTLLVNDSLLETHVKGNTTTLATTLTGLQNDEQYYVQVKAENSAGWGLYSSKTNITPAVDPSGTPPSKPRSLELAVHENAVYLTWRQGSYSTKDFDVQYRRSGASTWTEIVYNGNVQYSNNRASISGLTTSTEYEVRVRGNGTGGRGQWSDTKSATPNKDRTALEALYTATANGSYWSNWNDDYEPLDDWNGVTVDSTTGRVSDLDLAYKTLNGVFPAAIQDLTSLTSMELNNASSYSLDSLLSEQPTALDNLTLLPALTSLELRSNRLTSMPTVIGNLTGLTELDLRNNYSYLRGPLPDTFSNLTNLTTFRTSNTSLCLPSTLSTWHSGISAKDSLTACSSVPVPTPNTPTLTPGDKTIKVSWTMPNNSGYPITRYTIAYRPSSTSTFTEDVISVSNLDVDNSRTTPVLSTTLTGLTNGTLYYVKVKAGTSSKWGSYNSQRSATPNIPNGPTIYSLLPGDQQIVVFWEEPTSSNSSTITHYEIHYKEGSNEDTEVVAASDSGVADRANTPAMLSTTLTGLTNGKSYQVKIRAGTSNTNWGSYGSYKTATPRTPSSNWSKPRTPGSLELAAHETAVYVSWSKPYDGSKSIQDYRITYSAKQSNGTWGSETDHVHHSSKHRRTIISGLTADTTYQVKIYAVSEAGESATPATAAATTSKDRAALTALYKATGGRQPGTYSGWTATNWPSSTSSLYEPLDDWQGVTVDGTSGRVSELRLYSEQLTGAFPATIADLTGLTRLELDLQSNYLNNMLSARSDALDNLAQLPALTELDLRNNSLTSMPTVIGSLTGLTELDLSRNRLTGSIPTQIGSLRSLEILNLGDTSTSYNSLTGSIPTWIGNLTSLEELNLHNNKLTGDIPTQIGNLTSLEILNLGSTSSSRNKLTGSIPKEIGSLANLEELDLRYNSLTGTLPSEIANLTANLVKLDLSYNSGLYGQIPETFKNLTALNGTKDRSRNTPAFYINSTALCTESSKTALKNWYKKISYKSPSYMPNCSTPSTPSNSYFHLIPDGIGGTEIEVIWRAPNSNTPITNYKIKYTTSTSERGSSDCPSGSSTCWESTLSADPPATGLSAHVKGNYTTLSYTLTGLTNDTAYHVQVKAENVGGWGSYSSYKTITPAVDPSGDPPTDPPRNFKVAAHEDTLYLSWQRPSSYGSSSPVDYDVQYRSGANSWQTHVYNGNASSSNQAVISNLSTDTTYEVRARANNKSGRGVWSTPIVATTSKDRAALKALALSTALNISTWRSSGNNDYTPLNEWSGVTVSGNPRYAPDITNVTVTTTCHSVTATWTVNDRGEALAGQTLEYKPYYDSSNSKWVNDWKEATIGTAARSHTITTKFQYGAYYQARVKATNSAGSDTYTSSNSTSPGSSNCRPDINNLTVRASCHSVTVTWTVDDRGALTGQTLRHKTGSNSWTTVAIGTATRSHTITTSPSYSTTYQAEVKATNSAGSETTTSSSSTPSSSSCSSANDPSINNLTVTASCHNVIATWTVNDGGGAITGQTLRHRTGSGNWTTPTITSGARSYTITTNPKPGKTYHVEVTAVNSADSDSDTDSDTTSNTCIPDLDATVTSTCNSVAAAWTVDDRGAAITKQTLRHKTGNGSWTTSTIGATARSHTITTTPQNSTVYRVEVTATNSAGNSRTVIGSGTAPVACGTAGRVSALDFDTATSSLSGGTFTTAIGDLTELITLSLKRTSVKSMLDNQPDALDNLTLISKLATLNLQNNSLTATPTVVTSLTNLAELDMSDNSVTAIPTGITSLTKLITLNYYDNKITGSIPTRLSNLTKLQTLNLRDNKLTGNIPTQLGNLSNLRILDLSSTSKSYNRLTGSIPTQLGNLSNLEILNLKYNKLKGGIPTQLGNLTYLAELDLSYNRINSTDYCTVQHGGSKPPQASKNGGQHGLKGSIPAELGNLVNLTRLDLSYNGLTGPLPPELGKLTSLRYLDLRENREPSMVFWDYQGCWIHQNASWKVLHWHLPEELADLTLLTKGGTLRANNSRLCVLSRVQTIWYNQINTRSGVSTCSAPGTPSNLDFTPGYQSFGILFRAPTSPSSTSNTYTPITDYEIEYATKKAGPYTPNTNKWHSRYIINPGYTEVTSTVNSGLSNGTTYYVRVRAKNAEGTGPWLEGTVKPSGNVPAAPDPPNLTLHGRRGSFSATWTRPKGHKQSSYSSYRGHYVYELQYGLQGGKLSSDNYAKGEYARTGHTGIRFAGGHNRIMVRVRALIRKNASTTIRGPWSNFRYTTKPGAPAAPTLAAHTNAIYMSWSKPADPGYPAINHGNPHYDYKIRYRKVGTSAWTTHNGNKAPLRRPIHNLAADTVYEVQVQAANSVGYGPWSPSSTAKTSSDRSALEDVYNKTVGSRWTTRTNWDDDYQPLSTWHGVTVANYRVSRLDLDNNNLKGPLSARIGDLDHLTTLELTDNTDLKGPLPQQIDQLTSLTTLYTANSGLCLPSGLTTWYAGIANTDNLRVCKAPDAPTAPVLTPGDQQLEVSWNKPNSPDMPITDYDVEYRDPSTGTNWTDWPHTGTTRTAIITGLTNGVIYDVQVCARNAVACSAWSPFSSAAPIPGTTVSISATPAQIPEPKLDAAGNEVTTPSILISAWFTISLSQVALQDATVDWAITGTATHGTDYTSNPASTTGTAQIATGDQSVVITVTTLSDATQAERIATEANETPITITNPTLITLINPTSLQTTDYETITITLSNPTGTSLHTTDYETTVTIINTAPDTGCPAPCNPPTQYPIEEIPGLQLS